MASADDELIREYLVESQEHLATIENDLLEMEQAGEAIDEQLVNRVFRAAHSIKGGAGFFNLTRIRELAHRTESILDMVRSRQMVPTPEMVGVLLLAFDQLRLMLADWATSNEVDISEFVSALSSLTASSLPEHERDSLERTVSLPVPGASRLIEVGAFDLAQARRGGRSIYLVEYDLIRDLQRKNRSPMEMISKLSRCGTILEARCDFEGIGTLDDEPVSSIAFEILYASALEPELINDLLEALPRSVKVIDNQGAMVSLAELHGSVPGAAKPDTLMEVRAGGGRGPASGDPASGDPASGDPASSDSASGATGSGATGSGGSATPNTGASGKPIAVESTIRLNVALLDSLMNLAGEMVLSRNQLNEAVDHEDLNEIRASVHRLSLVTSELQSMVALTRMQPVGSLFAKFPRVVRDLARDLGKQAQLRIEGGEVEIDKSILEGLSDPLTHMIRNAVDHGIEAPAQRRASGKPESGTIVLRATHQAGQVVIEVADDGKGLSGERVGAAMLRKGMISADQLSNMSERDKMMLIFLPGVSTAEKLSDISGRGVGMDVVKTNLDKLGGKIEIDSALGRGTTFRIKLPLTLAIIPSLLVSENGQRYAIPQGSVSELIRIPAEQVKERIDFSAERPLLLLRNRLVPLVSLGGLAANSGTKQPLVEGPVHIVLVDAGFTQYGLIVEALHDSVEIVVKPLGRHLQGLPDYAGATILGDGRVALILDVAGLAGRAALRESSDQTQQQDAVGEPQSELRSMLLFDNAPGERCALPIEAVKRVERVGQEQIQHLGGRRSWQSGEVLLPVLALSDFAQVGSIDGSQSWVVIEFEYRGRRIGLLAAEPVDLIECPLEVDRETLRQRGISGSAFIEGQTTLLLELGDLAEDKYSPAAGAAETELGATAAGQAASILIAEDSDFFRNQIRHLVEAVGYSAVTATDGAEAWRLLEQHGSEIRLVATDVEMPALDGLELTRRIRCDARFRDLPVIALSALAGEEEVARGLAAGVTEYQVKLDPDLLLSGIDRALNHAGQ
ncbi:MAG: chemotaxis protein CheW [Acidobacteriota bacterium]|jgi:two-component system chemotaxis sensor kinase CheA